MKHLWKICAGIVWMLNMTACNDERTFDASGSFEAEEIIVSSEATGVIERLEIKEGNTLAADQEVGYIDSTQLVLHRKQLQAQIDAVLGRRPDVAVQLASLQEQLKAAQAEQKRVAKLVEADAATRKQLDDINAQVDVIQRQIAAQSSSLEISSSSISKEATPLHWQIEQLDEQIQKCRIINPIKGTVLAQYAKAHEVTAPGKPLYKIADLGEMLLRVYISADQLPQIKTGQTVRVFTDDGNGSFKETSGTISWISDKAEFTPKTIQTRDERANLVYAVKVRVKNEGAYKIGMYGEVNFQ